MTPPKPDATDIYTRYARRSLWLALGLIVLLGAGALLLNTQPGSSVANYVGNAMLLLPLAIVLAVVWLRSSHGARSKTSDAAARAVLHDELRQFAMQRAFRVGFFAMLFCQPVLILALTWAPQVQAAAIMGSITVLAGTALFLGAFLLHDRA